MSKPPTPGFVGFMNDGGRSLHDVEVAAVDESEQRYGPSASEQSSRRLASRCAELETQLQAALEAAEATELWFEERLWRAENDAAVALATMASAHATEKQQLEARIQQLAMR